MNLSINAQCQKKRLLDYLKQHTRITTTEARSGLDVMHPAARIQELKEDGCRLSKQATLSTLYFPRFLAFNTVEKSLAFLAHSIRDVFFLPDFQVIMACVA